MAKKCLRNDKLQMETNPNESEWILQLCGQITHLCTSVYKLDNELMAIKPN